MRLILLAVCLFLVGCGDGMGVPVLCVDGAVADLASGDMEQHPDLAHVTDGCAAEPDNASGGNAGARCASDIQCIPLATHPEMTDNFGAYCNNDLCCTWFTTAPQPFERWENCGDGWMCNGPRCMAVCLDR